jgi:hypothetical protein
MGMASLSKRITQKGGFRMRGRKLLAVLAGVSLLLGGIGVVFMALAQDLQDLEADFNFIGPLQTYVQPGDFAVIETIEVTDGAGGSTNAPLDVDRVCVAKTDPGSNKPVLRDSDILELRLYLENDKNAARFDGFGPDADDLLDIVPNPDLTVAEGQDLCENGVQFGDIGVLLFRVPGITQTASRKLYIVGTFSPAAQRGDQFAAYRQDGRP